MTTDPHPAEISLSPQTPTEFPAPLPTVTTTADATPASSPTRPTRADGVRIAIFGIPYAAFFLLGLVPASIIPQSWDLTTVNIAIDSVFLVMVLTFFWREFASTFSYLRTHPLLKIAVLFGLWFVVAVVQLVSRLAIYGINPPVAENQQLVIDALTSSRLALPFAFFVAVGVPLVEEIFYRHILIGKLSAYAPTWAVASISALLFAYMHCHQWQDMIAYLPISIVLTLVYVFSRKSVAYSWMFHALNNSIMVALIFAMQGALQNA